MTVGKKIRRILDERDMNISDLSFDSRVQEGTIRKIIDSNSDPRLSTVARIAKALGVSLDYLADGDGDGV